MESKGQGSQAQLEEAALLLYQTDGHSFVAHLFFFFSYLLVSGFSLCLWYSVVSLAESRCVG